YIIAGFVEVAAFAEVTHPEKWFVFTFVFFLISALLYGWDLRMIRQRRSDFEDTPERMALYNHIHDRQILELKLLPLALLFQGAVVLVVWLWPDVIMEDNRHLYVVGLQIAGGLYFLAETIRTFNVRQKLMTACIEEP